MFTIMIFNAQRLSGKSFLSHRTPYQKNESSVDDGKSQTTENAPKKRKWKPYNFQIFSNLMKFLTNPYLDYANSEFQNRTICTENRTILYGFESKKSMNLKEFTIRYLTKSNNNEDNTEAWNKPKLTTDLIRETKESSTKKKNDTNRDKKKFKFADLTLFASD